MATPKTTTEEPRWHASLAVIAILLLYVTLPGKLTFGPQWIYLVLVLGLLIPLSVFAPTRHQESPWQRAASIALIAIVNLFNVASVVLLVVGIIDNQGRPQASTELYNIHLLLSGGQIWLTNILVFGLWYWEIDGGGPEPRAHATSALEFLHADFLFPQMLMADERIACVEKQWKPLFVDYLFIAFTNALAFSPADTFPISRWAKMLMASEALISFVTIAIVVARAVGAIQ
jgi:hypothetical protein